MSSDQQPDFQPRHRSSAAARERRSAILAGLIFCVGLPGFITAIAPVSWIHLERRDGEVVATAETCAWFVVPYRTAVLQPLVGIDDRFIAGTDISRDAFGERYRSLNDRRQSEDQATLILHGSEASVEIPVSPASIEQARERCVAFLDDPQAARERIFVVANWKFGILIGGALSLLTLLYLGGCAWLVLNFVGRFGSRRPHNAAGT